MIGNGLNKFIRAMKWLSLTTSTVLAVATGYFFLTPTPPGSDSATGMIMFVAGFFTAISFVISTLTSLYFFKMENKPKVNKFGLAFFVLLAIILLGIILSYGITLMISDLGN